MRTLTRSACAILMIVTACSKTSDADKIGAAKFCFDELSRPVVPAEVNACMAEVDGLTSPGAHGVRCDGGFLREGFLDARRLVEAFRSIQGGTSSSNMQQLMGLLSFTSAGNVAGDYANADSTFNSCLDSGAKGATILASFAFFTMALVKYFVNKGGGCTGTPGTTSGYPAYDLSACVTAGAAWVPHLVNASSGDADTASLQTAIGSVVISTHKVSCTGSEANSQLCDLLSSAVAAGSTRSVGVHLLTSVVQ